MQSTLWTEQVGSIVPRDYQVEAVKNSYEQWDAGTVGTLVRAGTGTGKTIIACLAANRWLDMGANYRVMVLSYEQELVRQFAQEVHDVLGDSVSVGIEMGTREIQAGFIPQVVVASRQSLMTHALATEEQREVLDSLGIHDVKLLTKSQATRSISALRAEIDVQLVADEIAEWNENYRCNHELGRVSRLYKFDYRDNWLLVMDEAHKYSMKLKTVGHLVEWFEQNPNHRRSGITATPKRRDKVSIGTKLFPGIALDLPYTKCVDQGWAVPYVQKFIQVESIDFKALKESCKGSVEKWDGEINRILNTEKELAKLCGPMLDLVGERRTLIFSPTVEMAQNVADYINARCEVKCSNCEQISWHPNMRIGDGASCKCGHLIDEDAITRSDSQAHCLHGKIPHGQRTEVYRKHKRGGFQFLSVCGLCREGYNDPEVTCVAVFRPVSKAASSLAEQMKGRSCRPLKGCVDGLATGEERCEAIAASLKPNALIIDLVGVTGLAECASTVQIYCEGLDDSIVARAEEIALEGGVDNPQDAVEQAQTEAAEEAERAKLAREAAERKRIEAAERRAQLDAEATYTVHDVGTSTRDPSQASEKMLKYIRFLGMEFTGWEPSRAQASRMISQLKAGEQASEVARTNRVEDDCWQVPRPSVAQLKYMRQLGYRGQSDITPQRASEIIESLKGGTPIPQEPPQRSEYSDKLRECFTASQLADVAREIAEAYRSGKITDSERDQLIPEYKIQRDNVT